MALPPIAGETHAFSVPDAINHGVEQAIILNTIRYWLRKNYSDGRNIQDGYVWTYNTAKKLNKIFPYWSEQKCQRLMKKMADSGLILTANLNRNKWDQERWYTLPEFKIDPVDNSEQESEENQAKYIVSHCNSALINSDESNHQNCGMHSSRSMNVQSSKLMNDPYQDLTQDLTRSIQSPAPGIDPVGEAFQNVFWPLWEGRKYARGECLKIFAELVEQCGVSPMDFAKQLAADFNARIKSAQKGFDKMHPKSYLKGRRWEDQAPVTGTTPIPKVSESKKLHNRMASIQSEINSETLYMNGIRDNDPLRLSLRESAERKINRLNDELETCRQRLKELNKGLPGSEIYS